MHLLVSEKYIDSIMHGATIKVMADGQDNNNELSCSINDVEFVFRLTNLQFPNKDSTPLDLISVVMKARK